MATNGLIGINSIPFHGEDALLEKHYISKRSRRQKGLLAFIAQEEENQVFCYTNADLRKEEQHDEVLRFVAFWKEKTGKVPEELIFDSRLTTYANLDKLNAMNIKFMTLRRRTKKLLSALHELPLSAWRRIELDNIARAYKTPRIYDKEIALKGYAQPIRQIAIKDLGHEEPTILLTNHLATSPVKLIGRYAKRMLVENGIADAIEFFHMDALSSAVAMKVNCDLLLTRVVDIKEYNMHHICTCRFSFSISKSSSKAKSVSQYFSSFIRTCSNTLAQYSGMMSWRKASSKCLRCSLKFVVFANRDAQ